MLPLDAEFPKLASNRERMPELTDAARAAAAQRNMLENPIVFANLGSFRKNPRL